ncbi:MAG: glycerol-3-phosphate acyltransferase [Chloroflexota bacterium]
MALLLSLGGFLLGAMPFSIWLGRLVAGRDIRAYGDHNPGATNVLRAAGFAPFALALLLDISKGALPVGLAYHVLGIQDWQIVPIALAPPLGHAFSPFLKWRGGKAIAATMGVWIGLTIWIVPLVGLILLVIWSLLLRPSGWAVLLTLAGLLLFLLIWDPRPVFLAVLGGHVLLLVWKQRQDLAQKPELRLGRGREQGSDQ